MRRGNYGKWTTLDKSGANSLTGNELAIGHQCTNHPMYYTKYGKIYLKQNAYDGGTNTLPITQKYQNHKDIHHRTNVNNAYETHRHLVTSKLGTPLGHNHQE